MTAAAKCSRFFMDGVYAGLLSAIHGSEALGLLPGEMQEQFSAA
jgi:hypothetical protein